MVKWNGEQMKVSDEAVEAALDVVLGEGVVDCSTDIMRRVIRAALEAAIPLGLGEPAAWMRKWAYDGEAKFKVMNERTGRMRLHRKFTFLRVTEGKIFDDDVPLYASKEQQP